MRLLGFKIKVPNQGFRNNVKIGTNVSFGGDIFISGSDEVMIGDYTMIAYGVTIHTSTHDYEEHPMWSKRIDMPVRIGKHVWIGAGSIILPGVIVDDFSVVAAGSVVNAHVPKGAIVAGIPAKIIKYRNSDVYSINQELFDVQKVEIIKKSYLDKEKVCGEKLV